MRLKEDIATYLDRHSWGDGLHATLVGGLHVFRASWPGAPNHAIYRPSLCLVAQGAKSVAVGDLLIEYGPGEALVVSIDLPAIGQVTQATVEEPYLAVALEIDMGILRQVAEEMAGSGTITLVSPAAFVQKADDELVDCVIRLLRLLTTPEAVPILFPVIMRETCYRLLAGCHADKLHNIVATGCHSERMAQAISVLRNRYARQVRISELASAAGMSSSSFYQHFRTLTSMSPLQYQKRLRLLEARRLIAGDGASIADTAYEVGYESASQFSREYSRMFGISPKRDSLRGSASRVAHR